MTDTSDFKPETWTQSSNEHLKVSLVDGDKPVIQFSPQFTYPIFGTDETIFGFKDLLIHLAFDSVTLTPFVNVKFSAKMDDSVDERKVLDSLTRVLPANDYTVKDESQWVNKIEAERRVFQLPDEKFKVCEYTLDGEQFVVYKLKLSESDYFKRLHRRIQIFTLLFIEGASYIDENEPNWEIFWAFNKDTHNCVGYATTYKYWYYGSASEFDTEKSHRYRSKISQYIVLPPYQSKGHGSKLYQSIYTTWFQNVQIVEVTVEDPNEEFDDLRDRNDLKMLEENKFFEALNEQTPVEGFIDDSWLQRTRTQFKLEKRQFSRLVEMSLLHLQKTELYSLQVKKRLYQKNYEALMEIPTAEEQKAALTTSLESLTEDYERILKLAHLN
ncbi:histone acetyltransferase catalytic subunit HAT1 KNAG_0D02430 [Huiozyma naganishii CBS 8797]|uniref:Histone acetyltransferase type B catalytic subunit n=1 Tax=Huiozyma naganishii (strain ATCC MYA-139 / BCRC 22969 / CBS 8797 / KCTC 17520 / NBRC 10181 / NCYC 3082 / Yp74L-3) TaxID=1071383 RepID=J7RKI4_HUIN7|nr:hypothetical protein KNAG_0D02430 [Kazachstania naganishii CBS 8797]CCK69993.1 hypothetical protein KNAG_0D02430 [Kazachstania naganishii CBS 8797]